MLEDQFISQQSILERLTRLETSTPLEFKNLDKAIILARDQIDKDKSAAKEQINATFATLQALNIEVKELNEKIIASVNDTCARIEKFSDKLEKRKEASDIENASIKRLVWIGAGVALCLSWILQNILKW